jgi:MoxR-like ATPase
MFQPAGQEVIETGIDRGKVSVDYRNVSERPLSKRQTEYRENTMNEISPKEVSELYNRITRELGRVIVGQEQIVRLLLVSLFARGHCLLVGVPGLAKTLIVRTLADILHLGFRRIQFTPDLMPADIIGSEVLQERERRLEYEYKPGPVFANLILADEINRTPPKTQAALLEAMQEHKVTVGGQSRVLPDPFLVVATQNPIEQEGTYPLPEAQLDRFMFSLYLDYPAKAEEIEIVKRTTLRELPTLTPTVAVEDLLRVQRLVLAAPVSDHVIDYAVSLASATRPANPKASKMSRDFVEWGAGPRASQYLILGAKALALLKGKISPETAEVREVAMHVLQHRVITNYRATGAGKKSRDIVQGLLTEVPEQNY